MSLTKAKYSFYLTPIDSLFYFLCGHCNTFNMSFQFNIALLPIFSYHFFHPIHHTLLVVLSQVDDLIICFSWEDLFQFSFLIYPSHSSGLSPLYSASPSSLCLGTHSYSIVPTPFLLVSLLGRPMLSFFFLLKIHLNEQLTFPANILKSIYFITYPLCFMIY